MGAFGVASLGVGAGLGLWARATWEDARAACPGLERCPDDRGSELSDEAGLRADLATGAFAVGGAAVAGAAILWLLSAPAETALLPVVGPGLAGVSLGGPLP